MKIFLVIALLFVAFEASIGHEVHERHAPMEREGHLRTGKHSETYDTRTKHEVREESSIRTSSEYGRSEDSWARDEPDLETYDTRVHTKHGRTNPSEARNEHHSEPTDTRVHTNHSRPRSDSILRTGYVKLHADWDNAATSAVDYGKYFVFSNAEWELVFGPRTSGQTLDTKQCRAGQEVWKGTVKIWNGHGRRNSGAAAGQWHSKDVMVCYDCACPATYETHCSSPIEVSGDWDNPVTASVDHGKYFAFSNADWEVTLGSVDDGKLKVKQCRNGEEIWSGEVRFWRGGSQPHGRRNSGAASGQWETGDEIVGWQCDCTIDNNYDQFDELGFELFCGDTCEMCVAFDALKTATQALHDSMEDGILGDIATFVDYSTTLAELRLEAARKAKANVDKVTNLETAIDRVMPALRHIPYIKNLIPAIGTSLGTLKTAMNRLAEKEDDFKEQFDNLDDLNTIFGEVLPTTFLTANIVAGQANGTIHLVSTEGCSTCREQLAISTPVIDIAMIDDIVDYINGLLSQLSFDLTLEPITFSLSFLDDITEEIQEFIDLVDEVYDKVLADMVGEWQYQKCCEDVAGAVATMGDFFSDIASLVTCAADGAATGITMAAVTAALNPLLEQLDPLLSYLNDPIDTYNTQFATGMAGSLNNIKYISNIADYIVVFSENTCSLEFADLFELSPLCGNSGCTIPTLDTFSFGGGGSFDPRNVLDSIARQCADAWDNVKNQEMDDCCGTARIAAGAPEDGWSHGHRCESNLKSRMCSSPHVCLEGRCQSGASGALCLIGRDCLNPSTCLVVDGVCTNGELGEPCTIDSNCNSDICACDICTNGGTGGCCGDDPDCVNGRCVDNICREGETGDPCEKDSDCKNERCVDDVCRTGNTNDPCGFDRDCINGRCVQDVCRAGNNGDVCERDSDCNSGRCDGYPNQTCKAKLGDCASCNEDSDCISNQCLLRSTESACARSDGKMSNGCYCDFNSHCHSGRCEGSWPPYKCRAKLSNGHSCNEDSDCISNNCEGGFLGIGSECKN